MRSLVLVVTGAFLASLLSACAEQKPPLANDAKAAAKSKPVRPKAVTKAKPASGKTKAHTFPHRARAGGTEVGTWPRKAALDKAKTARRHGLLPHWFSRHRRTRGQSHPSMRRPQAGRPTPSRLHGLPVGPHGARPAPALPKPTPHHPPIEALGPEQLERVIRDLDKRADQLAGESERLRDQIRRLHERREQLLHRGRRGPEPGQDLRREVEELREHNRELRARTEELARELEGRGRQVERLERELRRRRR